MNLTPTEIERVLLYAAAELARRNLREGVPLSHPEAVSYIADEILLAARKDLPFEEVRDLAAGLLTADQVMPGVPEMIRTITVDAPFADGTKLVAVFDPIPPGEHGLVPGEIIPAAEPVVLFNGAPTRRLVVVNTGDRDIQVRSQTHFFNANPALEFDRRAAWGYKLAVASGTGVRFEPGIPLEVELVRIAGRAWDGADAHGSDEEGKESA